ncbi:MAG: GNAT family N-acetyltransferase [Fimbriimonadaceae bacterium]|nr:GNAT family N-acetyltransferase [Fimbriimonadaceae bacterium]
MEPFVVSTDPRDVDRDLLVAWLAMTYWAKDRPREVIEKSLDRSLCFTALEGDAMVGFARVVSDGATFAWLCDVVVHPERRGEGIGKRLIQAAIEHPDLVAVRWILATRDAHPLYEAVGFARVTELDRWMTKGFCTYREFGH